MAKAVIALGGNALGDTPEEQLRLVRDTARAIADLVQQGHEVVVVHGNGPQVGMISKAFGFAAESGSIKAAMPLPECGAMSQGYIGYHLQSSIDNELKRRGIKKSAVSVVTQVVVDESDEAFRKPTKPIGAFYSAEQAKRLELEKGYTMVEDSGRGYRQVVPSPKPVDVVEKDCVEELLGSGHIVITCGGGGIPVVRRDGELVGVDAVIDKDLASARLAELIKADMLVILTAVEHVAINFGRSDQRSIESMDILEAEEYIRQGQFAPGSMLPKIRAAISFAECGGSAIIASLGCARDAVCGKSGTLVYRK